MRKDIINRIRDIKSKVKNQKKEILFQKYKSIKTINKQCKNPLMLICVSVEHFSQMFVAVFTISFLFLSNPKSLHQLAQIAILKILSIILKVLTVVCYLFVKYFECANMDSQRGFYTRRVFRTHLNIYDGSISRRQLTAYKEYKE